MRRIKLISSIPTCETCLTCAGGGICPRGSDQTAQRDTTVATTQFVTAPDDSAHGDVDETHFESHKFQVRCNEADVGFSISSAGKTSQESDWFELLVAGIRNGKHGWSTVEHEVQSGQVGCSNDRSTARESSLEFSGVGSSIFIHVEKRSRNQIGDCT